MTTNDLLSAFDKFVSQVNDAYATAREHLDAGRYSACQQVLAQIAQSHARTSLSLRNVLVRRGLERSDEG